MQLLHCVFIEKMLEVTRMVLMCCQTGSFCPQRGDQFLPYSSLTSNLLVKDKKEHSMSLAGGVVQLLHFEHFERVCCYKIKPVGASVLGFLLLWDF